jgi:hypothetical protein
LLAAFFRLQRAPGKANWSKGNSRLCSADKAPTLREINAAIGTNRFHRYQLSVRDISVGCQLPIGFQGKRSPDATAISRA